MNRFLALILFSICLYAAENKLPRSNAGQFHQERAQWNERQRGKGTTVKEVATREIAGNPSGGSTDAIGTMIQNMQQRNELLDHPGGEGAGEEATNDAEAVPPGDEEPAPIE